LRNLQILKKSTQFLSSDQLCGPKSLDVAFNIAGVGKLAVAVNTGGHLIRVLNESSVSEGENLCLPWLVILKSV